MENSHADLTPDPETLVRLLELRNRYGLVAASALHRVQTESERHACEFGHPLAFGCCRVDEATA